MGGGGSRAFHALLACVLLSTTACVVIAGTSDKSIDPCFDGCGDAGGSPSNNGGVVLEEGNPSTDSGNGGPTMPEVDGGTGPTLPDASNDVDAGGDCPCPPGTQRDGDVCRMPTSLSSLTCSAPIQLPDCELKLALQICDTDPSFFYEEECAKESDGASRPSVFVRFGASPTGRWRAVIKGPFTVAKPNAACTKGGEPCVGGATETSTITIPDGLDGSTFAYGKRDGVGCDAVTVDVTFAE